MIFFGEYFALMYLYIYEAKILNMEIDRYILEKFFMNEADASEISAIEAWLNEDEANKNEFQKAYDRFVLTTLTVSKMELKAEMTRMQTGYKDRENKYTRQKDKVYEGICQRRSGGRTGTSAERRGF